MKGALQVTWLLFTALPVQRWLLAIGGLMVAACYLLLPPELYVLALVGVIIGYFATVFACGVLLRELTSPRMVHLIPRARTQVLVGMMLAVIIVATTSMAIAATLGPRVDPALTWLRVAAVVSLLMTSQFPLMGGAATGTGIWFGLLLVFGFGTSVGRGVAAWIGHSPSLLAGVLALTWGGFAAWLLRGRPLRQPAVLNIFSWGTHDVRASAAGAIRSFLFGTPAMRAHFLGGIIMTLIVIASWGTLGFAYGEARSLAGVLLHGAWMALFIGAYAGITGWVAARRSKLLWLHGGLREELFRRCEREAWVAFAAVVSGPLLLVPAVWLTSPEGAEYARAMLFQLCTGASILYLGLMHVRGWRVLDVSCALLLFLGWGLVMATAQQRHDPSLLLFASVAMLTAAAVLRASALHRWRRIDWLVCKPPLPATRQATPA